MDSERTEVDGMFDTETENTKVSSSKFFAVNDIAQRNRDNADKFTPEQIEQAYNIYHKAVDAFIRSRVFRPNFRAKLIAVKVDKVTALELAQPEVQELLNEARAQGVTVHRLGKNVVFRLFEK